MNGLAAQITLLFAASQAAVCPAGNLVGVARTGARLLRNIAIGVSSGAGVAGKSVEQAGRFARSKTKLTKEAGSTARYQVCSVARACTHAWDKSKSVGRAPSNAGRFRLGQNLNIPKKK